MAVVAPNTNQTLAMHYSYDFTFIEMSTNVFLIKLNETTIAMKSQSDKVLMLSFYTNSTEINLNVVKYNENDTIYLSIHYYVREGITPPPPPDDEDEEQIPEAVIFYGMTYDDVMGMTLLLMPCLVFMIFLSIKTVVRIKEHHTTFKTVATATDMYRSKLNEEGTGKEH